MRSDDEKILTVRLDLKMFDELGAIAHERAIPVSDVVRSFLQAGIEANPVTEEELEALRSKKAAGLSALVVPVAPRARRKKRSRRTPRERDLSSTNLNAPRSIKRQKSNARRWRDRHTVPSGTEPHPPESRDPSSDRSLRSPSGGYSCKLTAKTRLKSRGETLPNISSM